MNWGKVPTMDKRLNGSDGVWLSRQAKDCVCLERSKEGGEEQPRVEGGGMERRGEPQENCLCTPQQ